MSKVIWMGPVEAIPCNEDGQCGFVEEYAKKEHAFCYGYCDSDSLVLCPFYGLKEGTIVRMEVD